MMNLLRQPTMRDLYNARMRQPLYFNYRAEDIQLNLDLETPRQPEPEQTIYVFRAEVGTRVAFISEEFERVARQEARRLGLKFARLRWVNLTGTDEELPQRGVVLDKSEVAQWLQ